MNAIHGEFRSGCGAILSSRVSIAYWARREESLHDASSNEYPCRLFGFLVHRPLLNDLRCECVCQCWLCVELSSSSRSGSFDNYSRGCSCSAGSVADATVSRGPVGECRVRDGAI